LVKSLVELHVAGCAASAKAFIGVAGSQCVCPA
jgi:hypothetical protein